MKRFRFVEVNRERYDAYVKEYNDIKTHGGRVNTEQVTCDEYFQVKVYHNPHFSTIGKPDWRTLWTLVALALIDRKHENSNQYFILKEVEMGVSTKTFDTDGGEIK